MNNKAKSKVNCLVVDSGPFIKGAALQDWSQSVYTIRDVISEIKDSETRQRLQVLPYELILREPSQESIKLVTDFSKKTGDYQSLSAVDLRLIALTYQLERERGTQGGAHLRTDPIHTNKEQQRIPYSTAGFYTGKKPQKIEETLSDSLNDIDINKKCNGTPTEQNNNKEERDEYGDKDTALTNDSLEREIEGEGEREEINEGEGQEENGLEEEEEGEDDSWITPDNYQSVCDSIGGMMEESIDEISVGCMTTDYAMQNVLLQIGLNVVSIDGMLIKRIRTYAQQCKACFKVYFKSGLLFCPNCGNKSMIKVLADVGKDGLTHYSSLSDKQFSHKGLRYSLPLPKGGRRPDQLLLSPAQRLTFRLPRTRNKPHPLDPDYIGQASPFSLNDVTSRGAQIAFRSGGRGKMGGAWHRNPNQVRKKRK